MKISQLQPKLLPGRSKQLLLLPASLNSSSDSPKDQVSQNAFSVGGQGTLHTHRDGARNLPNLLNKDEQVAPGSDGARSGQNLGKRRTERPRAININNMQKKIQSIGSMNLDLPLTVDQQVDESRFEVRSNEQGAGVITTHQVAELDEFKTASGLTRTTLYRPDSQGHTYTQDRRPLGRVTVHSRKSNQGDVTVTQEISDPAQERDPPIKLSYMEAPQTAKLPELKDNRETGWKSKQFDTVSNGEESPLDSERLKETWNGRLSPQEIKESNQKAFHSPLPAGIASTSNLQEQELKTQLFALGSQKDVSSEMFKPEDSLQMKEGSKLEGSAFQPSMLRGRQSTLKPNADKVQYNKDISQQVQEHHHSRIFVKEIKSGNTNFPIEDIKMFKGSELMKGSRLYQKPPIIECPRYSTQKKPFKELYRSKQDPTQETSNAALRIISSSPQDVNQLNKDLCLFKTGSIAETVSPGTATHAESILHLAMYQSERSSMHVRTPAKKPPCSRVSREGVRTYLFNQLKNQRRQIQTQQRPFRKITTKSQQPQVPSNQAQSPRMTETSDGATNTNLMHSEDAPHSRDLVNEHRTDSNLPLYSATTDLADISNNIKVGTSAEVSLNQLVQIGGVECRSNYSLTKHGIERNREVLWVRKSVINPLAEIPTVPVQQGFPQRQPKKTTTAGTSAHKDRVVAKSFEAKTTQQSVFQASDIGGAIEAGAMQSLYETAPQLPYEIEATNGGIFSEALNQLDALDSQKKNQHTNVNKSIFSYKEANQSICSKLTPTDENLASIQPSTCQGDLNQLTQRPDPEAVDVLASKVGPMYRTFNVASLSTQTQKIQYLERNKLNSKRRELARRARHSINIRRSAAATTSIISTNKSFNFNDILRAEKEQSKIEYFLANKLNPAPKNVKKEVNYSPRSSIEAQTNLMQTPEETIQTQEINSNANSPYETKDSIEKVNLITGADEVKSESSKHAMQSENTTNLATEQHEVQTPRKSKFQTDYAFDKSPEVAPSNSRLGREWRLSYNQANLTNYTQFGVTNRHSVPKSPNQGVIYPNMQQFAQMFFNKRLHLKSPVNIEIQKIMVNTALPTTARQARTALISAEQHMEARKFRQRMYESSVQNRKAFMVSSDAPQKSRSNSQAASSSLQQARPVSQDPTQSLSVTMQTPRQKPNSQALPHRAPQRMPQQVISESPEKEKDSLMENPPPLLELSKDSLNQPTMEAIETKRIALQQRLVIESIQKRGFVVRQFQLKNQKEDQEKEQRYSIQIGEEPGEGPGADLTMVAQESSDFNHDSFEST